MICSFILIKCVYMHLSNQVTQVIGDYCTCTVVPCFLYISLHIQQINNQISNPQPHFGSLAFLFQLYW